MRIQREYMRFQNHWKISSSYDFQVHQQRSQRTWCFTLTDLQWFKVLPDLLSVFPDLPSALPGAPTVLSGAPRCSQSCHIISQCCLVPVIRDPSYSEGWPECPPRVWYSPQIDASKFTLHILWDTPGGFQWLKYILLLGVYIPCRCKCIRR